MPASLVRKLCEKFYYVLCGSCGGALQALVNRHGHFNQITKTLRRIENHFADNLSVEQLAAEVNMSVSAFHHNFKAVTNTSPLQYLKSYRLHRARMMMLHDGLKASTAAIKVGYEVPHNSAVSLNATLVIRRVKVLPNSVLIDP